MFATENKSVNKQNCLPMLSAPKASTVEKGKCVLMIDVDQSGRICGKVFLLEVFLR